MLNNFFSRYVPIESLNVAGLARRVSKHSLKELVWVSIGQVTAVVGSFVLIKVLTLYLSPSQYGEISLANTLVTLVGLLTFGPLSMAATRYWSICREKGEVRMLVAVSTQLVFRLSLLMAVIGMLVFVVIRSTQISQLAQWSSLLWPVVVLAIVSGQNTVVRNLHLAARHRVVYALSGGLQPWLYALLSVALLLGFGVTSSNALWGAVLAFLLVFSGQAILLADLYPRDKKNFSSNEVFRRIRGDLIVFALPFVATGVVSWFQSASDRWILQWFSGSATVGHYAALFQLGFYPVAILSGIVMQYLYPILLDRVGDGKDWRRLVGGLHLFAWALAGFMVLSLVGVTTGMIFHDSIFHITTTKQYWTVSYLLPLVMLWSTFFSLSQMMGLIPIILGRPKVLILPKVIVALITLVLSGIFVWKFGLIGVIIGGMISSLVFLLWLTVIAYRLLQAVRMSSTHSNSLSIVQ